jgi:two-component system, OmpR family, response regulator
MMGAMAVRIAGVALPTPNEVVGAAWSVAGWGARTVRLVAELPGRTEELLARLEALLRRGGSAGTVETKLRVGDLEMDLLTRTVQRAGQPIDLLPREFKLLEFLMRRAGQVVTRTMLLEGVWDYHFDPQTNVIDVHVSRLRGKLDKGFPSPIIHTVRGAGYVLRVDEGGPG